MTNLISYLDDGANYQAKIILMLLQEHIKQYDDIYDYKHQFKIARWENCKEQGYVVSLVSNNHKKQLNIAFFQDRNCDTICAVEWEQCTINSPTIDTMPSNNKFKKYGDVSKIVDYNKFNEMSEWIIERFNNSLFNLNN